MDKHTPGPWTVDLDDLRFTNGGERFVMAPGWRIALVTPVVARKRSTPFNAADGERDANARLIAAAPEQHEAAYALAMLVLQSDAWADAEIRDATDQVLAIHAKAEGR